MDTVRHRPGEVGEAKAPVGSVELVEGVAGKANRFAFAPDRGPGFMMAAAPGRPDWDRADGFSFYVKGDGSTNWAGLEWIDRDDYGLRYAYCFPIQDTEWRKVTVRWEELTPELAGPLAGAANGYKPSRFGNLWFGRWFYWWEYPAHSFAIDEVALEFGLARAQRPAGAEAPLRRLRERLKQAEPVTMVTMGDSLSDKRHWANRGTLWSEEVAARLQEDYGARVTLVNPALGGTTLSQNTVLIPRWARDTPKPDLVTIWLGYNDWDANVRGPRFAEYLRHAIGRLREQTGAEAHIVILTSCPAFDRWETMRELEAAAKAVAQETGAGLVDVATEFRRQGGTPEQALKQELWAWDKTHLGKAGHRLAAEAVLRVLTSE